MFDLFEKIEEALRELLTTFISSNLTTMFTDVNEFRDCRRPSLCRSQA